MLEWDFHHQKRIMADASFFFTTVRGIWASLRARQIILSPVCSKIGHSSRDFGSTRKLIFLMPDPKNRTSIYYVESKLINQPD